jgi:hypothetical protein
MHVPVTFVRKVNCIVLGQFISVKKSGYLQDDALAVKHSDVNFVSMHNMCSHYIPTLVLHFTEISVPYIAVIL